MKSLAGKAVVITGAGNGLGAAYARHAAEAGAAVLLNDLDAEAVEAVAAALRAEGAHAQAMAGNVADWALADRLIDRCLSEFGSFSGYVNNAGILRPALLADVTEDQMQKMLGVNLLGTAAGARAAILRLRDLGRGGSVVNVCSGSQAGDIALGAYAASKGAVASLTYAWAMELRGSGIRLNAVSPLAATAMAADNSGFLAIQSSQRVEKYPPLPAAAVSAPLISYLLSDASAHLQGQVIRLAGRELALVTHPMLLGPVVVGEWSEAAIAAAFDGQLRGQLQKLGLTRTSDAGRVPTTETP